MVSLPTRNGAEDDVRGSSEVERAPPPSEWVVRACVRAGEALARPRRQGKGPAGQASRLVGLPPRDHVLCRETLRTAVRHTPATFPGPRRLFRSAALLSCGRPSRVAPRLGYWCALQLASAKAATASPSWEKNWGEIAYSAPRARRLLHDYS